MILKNLILINLFSFAISWPNFELYTHIDNYEVVNSSSLIQSSFNHSKETKFIVHGFSSDSSKMFRITHELLKLNKMNVIAVDWKEGAQAPNYFSAFLNTKTVGQKIASFIKENQIQASKIHCIGHSLGAHICGFAGKIRRLGRISGLDPAGPLFKGQPSLNRLDKFDADFVDIIHTDSELGIQDPIGHLDFYPNGGAVQSGCLTRGLINEDSEFIKLRIEPEGKIMGVLSCSHTRSHLLYAESISNCQFKSQLCSDYDEFKAGNCEIKNCGSILIGCPSMGHKSHKFYKHGKYFLDTTKSSPFC